MDGNFVNTTPGSGMAGGGGPSSASVSSRDNTHHTADVSCSGSVAEASITSSVSSIESSPALRPMFQVGEILTIPGMDEPRSPEGSVEIMSHAGGADGPIPPYVERINPFEQQVLTSNSSESGSSRASKAADTSTSSSSLPTSTPNRSVQLNSSIQLQNSPLDGIDTEPRAASPAPLTSDGASLQMSSGSMVGNYLMEDDDNTVPSSAVTSSNPGDPASSTDGQDSATLDSDPSHQRNNSITRFFENTRRRIGSTRMDDPAEHIPDVDDDLLGDNVSGTLICGYLQKLGRNGKWQTRWFETDGECLSYYKSEKRTKVLATLDLEKVGSIIIDPEDSDGVSFNIQVLGRLYHLRADSKASCKDWVITLNRVKEARMQQGNVKLVSMPFQQQPVDLLDTPSQNDDFVAPRVVVLANRQRTRAVEEEQELNELIQFEEKEKDANFKSEKRLSTLGTVVLARWTKRKSSLSRLRSKLATWARSLRSLNCAGEKEGGLDNHVHPPGHDDKRRGKDFGTDENPSSEPRSTAKKTKDVNAWIGKEASHASCSPPAPGGLTPGGGARPTAERRHRKMSSTTSEDIRVLS